MFKNLSVKSFLSGFGLWLAWMGTLLVTWLAQFGFLFLVALAEYLIHSNSHFNRAVSVTGYTFWFFFFVFTFSLAGLFQWLIILNSIKRAAFWILATGVGSLVGMLIGTIVPDIGDTAAFNNFQIQMALTGVTMTIAQWFLIRRRVQHSYFWIITGVIGWPLLELGNGFAKTGLFTSFDTIVMIASAMVICAGAVLLFNRSAQRQFNALVFGAIALIVIIAGGIYATGNGIQPNLQQQISTFPATPNFDHDVHSVAFSPDGKLLAAGASGQEPLENTIKVWEISSGNEILTLSTKMSTYNISFSQDGSLFAAQYDPQTIRVWDVGRKKFPVSVKIAQGYPKLFAFSPKERVLVIASVADDGALTIGDPVAGIMLRTPVVNSDDHIKCIAFNPSGELLVARGEKVEWWNVSSSKEIREMAKSNQSTVGGYCAFSPDGNYLVEVGAIRYNQYDYSALIWDLNSGDVVQQFEAGEVLSVAYSPDGNTLALGRIKEQGILLWDVVAGQKLTILRGGDAKTGFAFSPDGKLLATGSINGEVMLWNVPESNN